MNYMKSLKRIAAVVMALMLLTSLGSLALAAAGENNSNIKITASKSSYTATGGVANVMLQVSNYGEACSFSITDVQLVNTSGILGITGADSVVAAKTGGKISLPAGTPTLPGTTTILLPITIVDGSVSGSTKIKFELNVFTTAPDGEPFTEYVVNSADDTAAGIAIVVVSEDDGSNNGNGDGSTPTVASAFRISPVDPSGNRVPAPGGNYGQQVTVRIPLVAKTRVTNVTIAPVLTTNLDTFPFAISNVDYTQAYPGRINAGQVLEFQYTFTLSKLVTAGVKQIDFVVTAADEWDMNTTYSDKISVFLTVGKGAPAPSTNPDTPSAVSTPKLIVDSYSFSTDKVYAGETFDVTFVLRNTSETEVIQNLQIHIADATSTVLPANSGSNTLYVAKIGKGETHTETISLQSAPGAEAKAYTLEINMEYEAASTKTAYKATETISVPVLQKIRVKADDPIIYDEAWIGSPFSMYLPFYNLGKSTVYNCTISVEGDGLAMQEGFFGGNVASGGSMNADFSVVPSVAGEISGNVVVSYEDVYGEAYDLKIPFTVFVNEMSGEPGDGGIVDGGVMPLPGEDGMVDGGAVGPQGSFPLWAWIAIGVAAVAAVIVLVAILKRRRSKESEEL